MKPLLNGLGKGGDVGVRVESGFELGTFLGGQSFNFGNGLEQGIRETFAAGLQGPGEDLGIGVAVGVGQGVFVRQEVGEPAKELGEQGAAAVQDDVGIGE